MAYLEIEALLQKAMGLKVTAIGQATLDRSIQRRMKILSLDDRDAYIEKIRHSTIELKELIEEVVISETWFFRDREPFKAMIRFLGEEWAPKNKSNLFRILSAPCSTGEEPYSVTMALLNSGWPPDRFSVHAVDISHRSVTRAKEAMYTEHSFRGADLKYRSKYFQRQGKFYVLNKKIRDKVNFLTGNILNTAFMRGLGVFDVIFFRNVLIYFDQASRQRAITTLHNILSNDGLLFVGHSEANLFSGSPFSPAPYSQAFAFQKKSKQLQILKDTKEPEAAAAGKIAEKKPYGKRLYPFQKKEEKKKPDLGLARKLADRGDVEQATTICEEYLDRCGPSAKAFALLGIILDTAGNTEQAEKLFRKALYLEPDHEEALVFLLLLAEKTGNTPEAVKLKERIKRLQKKKT